MPRAVRNVLASVGKGLTVRCLLCASPSAQGPRSERDQQKHAARDYNSLWFETTKLQSTRNATSTWKDQAKYSGIPLAYDQAVTYAKACQDDTAGPDACVQSDNRNHKW